MANPGEGRAAEATPHPATAPGPFLAMICQTGVRLYTRCLVIPYQQLLLDPTFLEAQVHGSLKPLRKTLAKAFSFARFSSSIRNSSVPILPSILAASTIFNN